MASSFAPSMQPLYRSALTVDTEHAQKLFDEEDGGILDDGLLDSSAIDSGLELSPPMIDSRRESFAIGGSSLFSPKTEDWHSVDMQSIPSNNPFMDSSGGNPFASLDQNTGPGLAPPAAAWTPFGSVNGMPTDYDANASLFRMPGQTPFSHPGNIFAGLESGDQSIPTSPHKDFMGANFVNGKKTRPDSPMLRSHNELRRGDGIRKKNARFEIPAERNLSNIDDLIAASTDETEIKELKQQKRLLRNRQAALDSRQRKKQHTERLEGEKKQFNNAINDMEQVIDDLKTKMDLLLREKQSIIEYTENLILERDELIRTHTNETGDLRKKVAVLSDHVQRLESNGPNGAGSNDFAAGYGEMEDMTMTAPWDNNGGFLNDFAVDAEVKPEPSMVAIKENENSFSDEADKPAAQQGGLLFMLFLVGAFVLSSRTTPAIPHVSEDVRVASATLLDNVLKDAGISSQPSNTQALAPQPSGTWADPSTSIPMTDMHVDGVAPSMLGDLGDSLTQPTQEQTNEQLFSLSVAQYNGVHSQDFIQHSNPERYHSQGRRNLAEALAAMRMTNKQNGAAEVYTRSLLWDQIPNEVVRNFAKMVADSSNAQNDQQQCNEAIS